MSTTPSRFAVPSVHPIVALATSPLLWGLAVTVAFYAGMPWIPYDQAFLTRYFAGHWIEYATMGLFVIGAAILIKKAWHLLAERRVFDAVPQPLAIPDAPLEQNLSRLEATLDRLTIPQRRTWLARRLVDVAEYLRGKSAVHTLDDHLRYLAELAAESQHGSYALIRTLTWAIPILGFLGTVIGITMAIANITPDQLESALGEVTGGLAVAFDTTALSLALSMVLVFMTYVVEKWEGGVLSDVEQFGIRQLSIVFNEIEETSPILDAERAAAGELLERSRELISEQTRVWRESLDTLRTSWVEVAQRQQGEFAGTLRQGMAATLADHARQLGDTRHELVAAIRETTLELREVADTVASSQSASQQAFAGQVDVFWNRTQRELVGLNETLRQQSLSVVGSVEQAVEKWHQDLADATAAIRDQLTALTQQGVLLGQIVEDERQLIKLQEVMHENLKVVGASETLEETLHGLSAAVHLLTMRSRHAA